MNKYFKTMVEDFSFEKRESQEKMANLIDEYLQNEKSCLIEAGTGIGKSLAYLLPAVLYAEKNNKKVVISTNTINLQEQLIEKDLPLLEKILGRKIKYILVKGRANYVCGNRLMRNCTDDNLVEWYKNTKTGDKSEIDFNIDPVLWDLVKCDKDFCVNSNCINGDNCFFYKSRKQLQNYDILIVNHSLLFSHFKYDNILPKFKTIILDEAHNVESIARKYFEEEINSKELFNNIGMMYNNKTNKGSFIKLIESLEKEEKLDKIKEDFISSIDAIYYTFFKLFTDIMLAMEKIKKSSVNFKMIINEIKFDEYILEIFKKYEILDESRNEIKEIESSSYVEENVSIDFEANYSKLKEAIMFLKNISNKIDEEYVNWVKVNNNEISIVSTPLDVSTFFAEMLSKNNMIMTSATLRVNNSFEYIKNRLGINKFDEYNLDSPFDYDKNMKIYVSKNEYDPNSNEYIVYVIDFLNKYINDRGTGTFILCTSYKQVEQISRRLKLKDFNILVQGEMSRNNMIKSFKENEKSVLIGTDSFWEGVDVKGEKLQNVIIVKLPFQAPDEPVTQAIIDNINKKGNKAFLTYQLPNSIIKLRQGIGRLIRSNEDNGEIVILDNRILTKYYGKIILNSFPSKNIQEI